MSIVDKYKEIGKELLDKHVDFISFSDVLDLGIAELDATDPNEIISFGYPWLDEKLTGLFPGELVVIGSESGGGKTTFATNIVYKASQRHRTAVFALEDRLHDYAIKALYFAIGRLRKAQGKKNYPWNVYRRNEIHDSEYKRLLEQARKSLANDNLHFANVKKQMDIEMLEYSIEEQVKKGVKLFLIDHLHYFDLLRGDSTKADYVEKVMVSLKMIQNRTGARVILIVHYRKLNGTKPSIDSFKDSMSITQNANYVINLWRDRTLQEGEDLMQDRYDTKIFVPKSRNPNGEFTIDVQFDPDTNDFKNPVAHFGTPADTSEVINNSILKSKSGI